MYKFPPVNPGSNPGVFGIFSTLYFGNVWMSGIQIIRREEKWGVTWMVRDQWRYDEPVLEKFAQHDIGIFILWLAVTAKHKENIHFYITIIWPSSKKSKISVTKFSFYLTNNFRFFTFTIVQLTGGTSYLEMHMRLFEN